MGQGVTSGYDSFNRLTSMTNSSGLFYSYTYDRYGNRWAQTPAQAGFTFSQSFNPATNQISSSGFSYDAAGNLTSDGTNNYSYDAEGNLIEQTSGDSTTQNVYDALNNQVAQVFPSSGANIQSVFDQSGRLASVWYPNTSTQILGKSYWGATAIYSYSVSKNMGYFAIETGSGPVAQPPTPPGLPPISAHRSLSATVPPMSPAARTIPTTASPGCGPGLKCNQPCTVPGILEQRRPLAATRSLQWEL